MRVSASALVIALMIASPVAAQPIGNTLEKISKSGKIILGYRDSSPPFSSLDEGGRAVGYSIDLCLRIAEAAKQHLNRPDLKVQFVPVKAEDRLQKVIDGTIDIECGVTTNTLSRQEQVAFTNTIFITGASLLLPAGSSAQGVTDLAGRKIAVVQDTTTEKALRERLAAQKIDARVVTVSDDDVALKMLAKGEVDAHAGDQIVLIGLARTAADPGQFVLAPELFTYEPYGLVVRRDDPDFRLVADRTLARLYRSGEIMQVFEKWFASWGGRPSRLLLAVYALNGLPE
jgi:glutamate/aspartate transport system substrate-binding protein